MLNVVELVTKMQKVMFACRGREPQSCIVAANIVGFSYGAFVKTGDHAAA